jgi:hypothetical protein
MISTSTQAIKNSISAEMNIFSACFYKFFERNILLVQGFDGEVKVYAVNDGFCLIYEIYGYKRRNPPKQGNTAPQLGAAF